MTEEKSKQKKGGAYTGGVPNPSSKVSIGHLPPLQKKVMEKLLKVDDAQLLKRKWEMNSKGPAINPVIER